MLEFKRVEKTNLADDLAERIAEMIRTRVYEPGDRLPSIMEMARSFGVGHPTVREALKKLEIIGIVNIRHGSGVYVGTGGNNLLVSNPVKSGNVTKKLLLDLIEARIPIEVMSIRLAASVVTDEQLETMRELLAQAEAHMQDDEALSHANMGFHCEIAKASGNTVIAQMQQALANLFQREQRQILSIQGSREVDHKEHLGLFEALKNHDVDLAVQRMQSHLEGVRQVLDQWDPEANPLT